MKFAQRVADFSRCCWASSRGSGICGRSRQRSRSAWWWTLGRECPHQHWKSSFESYPQRFLGRSGWKLSSSHRRWAEGTTLSDKIRLCRLRRGWFWSYGSPKECLWRVERGRCFACWCGIRFRYRSRCQVGRFRGGLRGGRSPWRCSNAGGFLCALTDPDFDVKFVGFLGAGVLADLDPPRIGPPGPNPVADMDPPVHIR